MNSQILIGNFKWWFLDFDRGHLPCKRITCSITSHTSVPSFEGEIYQTQFPDFMCGVILDKQVLRSVSSLQKSGEIISHIQISSVFKSYSSSISQSFFFLSVTHQMNVGNAQIVQTCSQIQICP